MEGRKRLVIIAAEMWAGHASPYANRAETTPATNR